MSRHAIIVGAADGADPQLEQALQLFRYTRVLRLATIDAALDAIGLEHVDLLLLPIDAVDEAGMAAIERVARRERHMGVIATAPQQDPALMLRAMRSGIQEFLVRPMAMAEFLASSA
mgnify:FL=1